MNGEALYHITCPQCGAQSKQKASAIPTGRARVFCKGCEGRFQVDLAHRRNCRRLDPKPKIGQGRVQSKPKTYPADDAVWRIHRPFAVGFQYSLSGIEVLIRGGMVNNITPILPPGAKDYVAAGEVPQLKAFLDAHHKVIQAAPAQAPEPPEWDLDGTLDDSKEWYNMDCGQFFNVKVKGLLTREISLKS